MAAASSKATRTGRNTTRFGKATTAKTPSRAGSKKAVKATRVTRSAQSPTGATPARSTRAKAKAKAVKAPAGYRSMTRR
jgi:hypothetical protein